MTPKKKKPAQQSDGQIDLKVHESGSITPSTAREWMEKIDQIQSLNTLIKVQAEFENDLSVVPDNMQAKVLAAFDDKAGELECFGGAY